MEKQLDKKIGQREFFAIVVFFIAMKSSDNTLVLLLNHGENATWIMSILLGLISLAIYYILLSILKKYEDKNLVEIIYLMFGKYVGFIVCFLFIIELFCSFIVHSRSAINILNTLYFPKTPFMFLYIVLTLSACFIASGGFQALGNSCKLSFPYILLSIFFLIVTTMKDVKLHSIYPIFGPGASNLVKYSLSYSSICSNIIILSIFFPYVKSYKEFKLGGLFGIIYSISTLTLLVFACSSLYGYEVIKLLNYPFQALTRASHIGKYSNNIDAIFLITWVVGALLHFSIYLYSLVTMIGYVFNFKNYEKLLIPIALITPLIGMIPENNVNITYYFRNLLLNISSAFFMIFTLTTFLLSRFKVGSIDNEK